MNPFYFSNFMRTTHLHNLQVSSVQFQRWINGAKTKAVMEDMFDYMIMGLANQYFFKLVMYLFYFSQLSPRLKQVTKYLISST